jgi:hypothetical protein
VFVYPVPPAPPTAILVSWFRSPWFKSPWFASLWRRSGGAVRVFPGGWDAAAEAYRPAAIAGTWPQMEALLRQRIVPPSHALIVLHRAKDLGLNGVLLSNKDQRQELWQAFRVPVFEQIVGENGALLAAECEAHAGLHIESSRLDLARLSVENTPCGCGRKTPRIGIGGQIEELRSTAASAR